MSIVSSGDCVSLLKKHNIKMCRKGQQVRLLSKKDATVEEIIECEQYEPSTGLCVVIESHSTLPDNSVISIEAIDTDSRNYALKLCMDALITYQVKPCGLSNQKLEEINDETLVGEVEVSANGGASDKPVTLMGEAEGETI